MVQPRRLQVGDFTRAERKFAETFARQFHVDGLRRLFEGKLQARNRADGRPVDEARRQCRSGGTALDGNIVRTGKGIAALKVSGRKAIHVS